MNIKVISAALLFVGAARRALRIASCQLSPKEVNSVGYNGRYAGRAKHHRSRLLLIGPVHRSSRSPLKNGCLSFPSADLARYSISASSTGSTQMPR
jgi:hypothetical protein